MRKFKFRFWKDKKLQGILELKNNNILDMAWEWDNVDQFTGLLDKSGVEIYEGDLLRTDNNRIGTVIWHGNHFGIGFSIQEGDAIVDYDDQWHEFEVIGNIYENPELLKDN